MKFWLVLSALLLLGGCAGLRVDYVSDPPGASLYEEGRPVGMAPIQLTYQPDATFDKGGCFRVKGLTAKWASGAQASISYLDACASQGRLQHYVFVRPDVPGREVDMNFALQLQRNGIMQQRNQNQAVTNFLLATQPQPQPRTTINCTSRRSGNQVFTDCN